MFFNELVSTDIVTRSLLQKFAISQSDFVLLKRASMKVQKMLDKPNYAFVIDVLLIFWYTHQGLQTNVSLAQKPEFDLNGVIRWIANKMPLILHKTGFPGNVKNGNSVVNDNTQRGGRHRDMRKWLFKIAVAFFVSLISIIGCLSSVYYIIRPV